MKKFNLRSIGKKVALGAGALAVAASNASAAVDLSTTTIDASPVETACGIIITGILVVWVCRKVYVFFKKS